MDINPDDCVKESYMAFNPPRIQENQTVIIRGNEPRRVVDQRVRVSKVWRRETEGVVVVSGKWRGEVCRRLKGVPYWEVYRRDEFGSLSEFNDNLVALQTSRSYPDFK